MQHLKNSKEFCKEFEEYNRTIGYALEILENNRNNVLGRDEEIERLFSVLERPQTPIALLLGEAGVGKTSIVEQLVTIVNSKEENNVKYVVLSLKIGFVACLGIEKMQSVLSSIFDIIKDFEKLAQKILSNPNIKFILFIDEIHMLITIFGTGTKIGGDLLKEVLARSPIKVIGATTRREYDSTIAVDKPLAERFKQIEIKELTPDIVQQICYNWWENICPTCHSLDDEIIKHIIRVNALYRSDSAEPRKTLDILEDLVSYCKRVNKQPTLKQVNEIYKQRYSINLDFNLNVNKIYDELEKNIYGQPHALYVLKRLIRTLLFPLDPYTSKPMATALFTGSTGTGKTETVKILAHALYPNQHVLLNINMPDYKTAESEILFRKKIGEYVRHTPNAIILLDEFEKAHESIRDSLLTILDEGIINFDTLNRENIAETNHVSLRNTIVIATTNAGANIFKHDTLYSLQSKNDDKYKEKQIDKAQIQTLIANLHENLQANGFKAEMLGRFDRIIPYRGLSEETVLKICEKQLEIIQEKFLKTKNINIHYKPKQYYSKAYNYKATDVALFITFIKANAQDTNSGGARNIHRQIYLNVVDSIIEATFTYPETKNFLVTVDENNPIFGNTAISDGEINVQPC